ncbi:MAG TPA: sugar ABC transporter substrate-binding protein [Nevskiaceae bacterium]
MQKKGSGWFRRREWNVLAGALATAGLALAASAAGTTAAVAADSCPGANKTLHVAFVYSTTSQNPFQEMADGAMMAAKEDGNTKIQLLAPPSVDGQAEVQMLQSATATATDGIAWEAVLPDLFLRSLQAVKKAGIPLVAVDNMTPPGVTPDLLVSNSNFEVGKRLGEAFVDQHPDPHGEVVLGIDIPTLGVLQDRMKGLQSVLKAKLPDMKVTGPFDARSNSGVTATTQAWQAQVNAHPDAVGFLGVGGPDGIALPLIKQKSKGKWLAGSADIPPQALEGVKSGALFALSSPEHFMKGYIAIHEIIKQARTCKPMPHGWWNSGTLLITKSNIDQILQREKSPEDMFAWFKTHAIEQQLANPPLRKISELN